MRSSKKDRQVSGQEGAQLSKFSIRIFCGKYLQHQQNLYHVFVNFKKAFDRVRHVALWATTSLYNICDNLIRTIQCLYNKVTSAVYHDNNIGEWFRTTIGVRQGCLLSSTLSNIFLERIMADAFNLKTMKEQSVLEAGQLQTYVLLTTLMA